MPTTDAAPTIWRDRRDRWNVEVRADGLILVQVTESLDDASARDLSSALHRAANGAKKSKHDLPGDPGRS